MKAMSNGSSHCLFILSLMICPCLITAAQLVFHYKLQNHTAMIFGREIIEIKSDEESDSSSTQSTTNLRSWRGQNVTNLRQQHRLLRTAHGILNIIGWGTFLPIGAIIARYFRKFPMRWNEWYSFHVIFQTGGYLLGTVGWFIGLLSSKQLHSPHDDRPHRILGIIIFTFTTIQMLAIFWHPKREEDEQYFGCQKSWVIYHQLLGYALLALIIADIFQGIKYQAQASRWRWTYVGILVVLALTCISLEIFKRVRSKILRETVELNSNMYTSP